jgi:hypothetical protein
MDKSQGGVPSDASRAVNLMPKSQRSLLVSPLFPDHPTIQLGLLFQHVPSPIHLASDSFLTAFFLSLRHFLFVLHLQTLLCGTVGRFLISHHGQVPGEE